MKFKVKWEAEVSGKKFSGVESTASWFLVDQQGKMYSYGPMEPIRPIGKAYTKCEPLIQIGEEWLSISEIEERIK